VTKQEKESKSKMSESSTANTIARERVDNLATRNSEPAWLKELRLNGWEQYLQTPMPAPRDEEWRKVDVEVVDLSSLKAIDLSAAVHEKKPAKLPEYFQTALKAFENAAGTVVETTGYSWSEVREDLTAQGVIFCSLKTAVEKHHDLVRPYLEKKLPSDGKFALMNKALFNSGSFLYVPANVEVNGLFLNLVHLNGDDTKAGVAVFPRTVIVLAPNSKASILSAVSTEDGDDAKITSLSNVSNEVFVGEGAKLSYIELHKFGQHTFAFARNHNEIARDASFYSLTVGLGGGQIKSDIDTLLTAPGAQSDVEGVVLGDGSEHFSFNTMLQHNAPDTKSNINFRVALKDSASSAYLGTIRVAKVAQRTDSMQSNKNLLLGSEAKADSIPKLEILADDVKCSHGATVGPVDKEQLFYLQSRGLTRTQAEELVVTGFFKKIFDTCTVSGVTEYITDLLADKIHGQD
jgi:Fe-S cluster assembly protein SufD